MTEIRFEDASRVYAGNPVPAVDALDLLVESGEFMVLVGPSGSGKSTALRMIAGLEQVDTGGIWIGGRDVTWERPQDRDVAMVFQNYALYPFLNVEDNIAFPLKMAKVPKADRHKRVVAAAELLELSDLLARKPSQLSGGQRQRVAMGRAIVREPSAFLMDEPLSNLDALLRVQMRSEIASLQRRLGVTTVYVTHDQVEAMTMGTRVAVLRDGRLQQCARPRELYDSPANAFVAGFIGSPPMNLLTLPLADGAVTLGGLRIELGPDAARDAGAQGLTEVTLGVRPESMKPGAAFGVAGRVENVEHLGADSHVSLATPSDAGEATLVVRIEGTHPPDAGEKLTLALEDGAAHWFSPATGDRLGDRE
ncbi:MAG TPA: ABC transporter ATP-binding protein [Solirubrobacteraceae bacterium]|nr:ABC transporter ATP-binding protein [Solirubrobacteraceae bacterium]